MPPDWPAHSCSNKEGVMTIKSRRAVLAGAASLSAAIGATSAFATASSAEISLPELVAQFISVRERRKIVLAKEEEHARFIASLFYKATGVPWSAVQKDILRYRKISKVYYRLEDANPSPHEDALDEINEELFPLAEEILKKAPQSLIDLAWQAEVAFVSQGLDVDDGIVRRNIHIPWVFIENVRAFVKTRELI
jgi:hypothetical protein